MAVVSGIPKDAAEPSGGDAAEQTGAAPSSGGRNGMGGLVLPQADNSRIGAEPSDVDVPSQTPCGRPRHHRGGRVILA